MEKNKKNKKKIFIGLAIALALTIALFLPQNSAPDNSEKEKNLISEEAFSNASSSENEVKNKQNSKSDEKKSGIDDKELKNEEKTPKNEENSEKNKEKTEKAEKNKLETSGSVLEETSKNSDEISDKKEEKTEISENLEKNEKNEKNEKTSPKGHTCFLSVRCDTLVSNIGNMKPEKAKIVPSDGIVFAEKEVEFFEKESVFNVLKREMKKSGIHFEFTTTPVFGSAYIEGIANIYEFDCGELSGWMYKVNGEFPKFGCSQYILNDGDKIEWVYTCDLGKDVGENYGIGKQKDE